MLRGNDRVYDSSEIVDIGKSFNTEHNVIESHGAAGGSLLGASHNWMIVSKTSQQSIRVLTDLVEA